MLTTPLLHPEILEALASAGHNSRVLIADGNFPAATALGSNARLVHLNLSPGVVSATQVLAAMVKVVPFEEAQVMEYHKSGPYAMAADPPIWADYRELLEGMSLTQVPYESFYEKVAMPDVALVIQTADQALFANLLLTIGVVMPG